MELQQTNQAPKLKKIHAALQSALLSLTLLSVNQLAMAEDAVELKQVDVVAPATSDTRPVKGYQAKKSNAATKTDTLLRDVPQAVSIITQDLIQDQAIQSIAEAVRYVPGVQSTQGEGNRDALVLRGNQTTGDLFVDGLRDDVQTYRDLYNTDRIEVLKGPNGMIFGRGGAGGVVNRVSKEAGWDPISQITASYGAYDQKRISADFGQALSEDVAFRINAVYENSDSYREGVNIERYGITPTLTLKPTENTKIVVGFEYFKDERTADRGVPAQSKINGTPSVANPDFDRRPYKIGNSDTFFGNARLSPTETETVAFNAAVEHAFDNGVTIKNRTRYADYDKYYQNVFANSAVNLNNQVNLSAYRDSTKRENFINQTDVTFSLKTGSIEHKLLAGVEIANQKTDSQRLDPPAGLGAVSANDPFIANVLFNTLSRSQKSDVDIFGVYLQDQITLSPKWQAIVGLRHDKFETDHTNILAAQQFKVTDNLLSPRAGLIFKPVEPVSIYTNYSLSYVPRAGDQLAGLTATNFKADPEKFINYELGAKWDINPDLAVTAAVYKLERQNVSVADPTNPTAPVLLIDGQETKGVELSIAGNITSKWSLFGGYAYQDGEITKEQVNSNANNVILKGADLAQTPKHTFSLWNRYDINQTWGVALGVISRSDMYAALPTASQSTLLPGYTRLDAAIYAKINKQTRLQINLENLTNKEYALYAHNNNNITPGSPITGRATLVYNF